MMKCILKCYQPQRGEENLDKHQRLMGEAQAEARNSMDEARNSEVSELFQLCRMFKALQQLWKLPWSWISAAVSSARHAPC